MSCDRGNASYGDAPLRPSLAYPPKPIIIKSGEKPIR